MAEEEFEAVMSRIRELGEAAEAAERRGARELAEARRAEIDALVDGPLQAADRRLTDLLGDGWPEFVFAWDRETQARLTEVA